MRKNREDFLTPKTEKEWFLGHFEQKKNFFFRFRPHMGAISEMEFLPFSAKIDEKKKLKFKICHFFFQLPKNPKKKIEKFFSPQNGLKMIKK